ncbi:hypothetical protein C8Q76DRAFT_765584 [Earliella scabrosa]|nr:hypothetical protein C8Q76DRAFT_765584 [Earliella scabrosa]
MAVAAECKNCAADNASIGVVLGVVGGLSLVALLVAVVVPLVRRRVRRRGPILSASRRSTGTRYRYSKARTSDDIEDGMYLPSRPSSLLHQKMFPGPDKNPPRPLILDPLRPISAITWSDLRSSPRSPAASSPSSDSASSHSVHDLAPPASLPTHMPANAPPDAGSGSMHSTRATSSHRSTSMSTNGTGGAIEDEARGSLPSLQHSPTPPGLPSKRGSHVLAARRASLPITPVSPSDASPSPASSSRHALAQGMPVYAPAPVPVPSSSSPSAAPYNPLSPVSPLTPANLSRTTSLARSATHRPHGMDPVPEDADAGDYAETRSLQLPSPPASPDQDLRWRGSSSASASTSGRRPSLSGRQSAPNALPFRPRSSTGPSVALPLTAAFQTSVLRSGSSSSATGATPQRYPSITASTSPPARSRPSSVSVSVSRASPDPDPLMSRPTEAFRRLSTTDIRHRTPHSHSGAESPGRAFLRTSDAARVPQVQEMGRGPSSYRHATVYSPPPPPPPSSPPMPGPLTPPALSPLPSPPSAAPRLTVHTSGSSGRESSHARALGMGAAHPSTVTWKSLASGSRASLASQQSRSRSNSVRSVRTLPGLLPPIDPVTPLSLSLEGSPEEEERAEDAQGREQSKF